MKIGVDIDGVLTNDDDYILDHAIKFTYENNLNSYVNPYNYETRKFDWDNELLDRYRSEYFYNYVENEAPRKFAKEIIDKLLEEGNEIYIITSRHLVSSNTPEGEDMRNKTIGWLKKNRN